MAILKVNNQGAVRNWNGIFNDLFGDLDATNSQFSLNRNGTQIPVNIEEKEDAFEVSLLAAGRNKENFVLNVENKVLTISYNDEKGNEVVNQKMLRREFASYNFKRSFNLDEKVNTDAISAKYENGILYVTLPKKEEVKPVSKQIAIQ